MRELIDTLRRRQALTKEEWITLLENRDETSAQYLFEQARQVRHAVYGQDVYIRGLIEISNYCKNDCYYCGIRRSNRQAARYRLSPEEILACTQSGYALGFRTFVLQGGEDAFYTDALLCDLIRRIKEAHPDCAVTLSLGEREAESYRRLFAAGADRYLLRHETASETHYAKLHPPALTLAKRKECLFALKRIGYQTGSGFLVGSPGQTAAELAEDLLFLKELEPQMVGIGPFIPHQDTPFAEKPAGSVELTLFLLALLRLMLPYALLPATTALGTLDAEGREKGILAGANVVMPNLSPPDARSKYTLYDKKLCTGLEAAEQLEQLKEQLEKIGYRVVISRGDFIEPKKQKRKDLQ
ncbi:MAG: [FeFe] hydrogenase H-cluster radical SAM maturase HydE [Clostridia bacterium]